MGSGWMGFNMALRVGAMNKVTAYQDSSYLRMSIRWRSSIARFGFFVLSAWLGDPFFRIMASPLSARSIKAPGNTLLHVANGEKSSRNIHSIE
jgi:hypothetical protein